MLRYVLCLMGILFAFPLIVLITFALGTSVTVSGAAYLLGCSLIVSGLILTPWRHKVAFVVVWIGTLIIVSVAGLRLTLGKVRAASANFKIVTLPSGREARWLDYLIDEQDSVLLGEAALHRIGGVSSHEHEEIIPALRTAYSELRVTGNVFPSPFASTYLGLQQPASFDTVVIGPENGHPVKAGVIFLHGYMGNVTIQCWRIAQAVQKLGMITVCPSTDWIGDWWIPQGEAIVRATFRYFYQQGIQKIVLGGFSNGAAGTSRLAPKLGKEESLIGLFLIAGATNGTEIRNLDLPVLVVQGTQDERMPVTAARQFVQELGDLATYREVESDHFLIMKQPELVQDAITTWLTNLELGK